MQRLLLFLGCITFSAFAQKIKVLDLYTEQEIENVVLEDVLTKNRQTTNHLGWVLFKKISEHSIINIQHKNYKTLSLPFYKIKNEIFLEPKSEILKSVVLSISRVPEKKWLIPEPTETITKKEIDQISPQTSADLLSKINHVRVQKSQLGGGSPVIRGMEANRVLLVVDGVRMNNAIYRTGHLQNSISVSPLVLERVETIFGPSSVTYGSDALGGVVHYYTKKLHYTDDLVMKNNFFYRHSTVNKEHTTSFSSQVSHQKWSFFTSISYSAFDDLRMGKNRTHGYKDWGKVYEYSKNNQSNFYASSTKNTNPNIQKNTGYHQLDVLQKIMFPLHQKIDLIINGQLSTTGNVPNFGKLNDTKNGVLKFAEWYYGPQQRFLMSAQAKFKDYQSLFKNGTITLAYQNISESRINRKFEDLNLISRSEKVDVYSLNADFYLPIDKRKHKRMFYGLELVHNKVSSRSKGESLAVSDQKGIGVSDRFQVATRYPDAGSFYSSMAAYTSFRYKLSKKHVLNTGLRLTSTFLSAKWDQNTSIHIPENKLTLNNTALTGSLGYIYKPKNIEKISFILSKGFRSPNIDDIGKIRAKSNKLTVPNTQLKPENLYSAEVVFAKELPNQKANFNANLYYSIIQNYIARAPSSEFGETIVYDGETYQDQYILANTNVGKAAVYGASINGFYKFLNCLKLHTGITYTKGFTYQNKRPLSSIPPVFGNISLGLDKVKYAIALEYRFSMAKKLKDYNQVEGIDNLEETPNGNGVPYWGILNINTQYKFGKNFRLQFQIQNMLDVHYKEFASAISAPGQNISMVLAYSF